MSLRPLRRALLPGALGVVAFGAGCAEPRWARAHAADVSPPPAMPTSSSPWAVALCLGATPSECEFLCSGTLVAPNLVLTARHCGYRPVDEKVHCATDVVADTPIAEPTSIWVTTDPAIRGASHWHRGARMLVPQTGPGTAVRALCGADLMLLVLEESIGPREASPASPRLSPSGPGALAGRTFALAGYGQTAPEATDAGVRRARRSRFVECAGAPAPAGECEGLGDKLVDREITADTTGCEGDSGAGAFDAIELDAGRPVVSAVLSRGQLGASSCGHAIYERVDVWAGFLVQGAKLAAEAGGYASPAWTNGAPAEDVPIAVNPFSPRALGARCKTRGDCDSGLCASANGGLDWACASSCEGAACPPGFACGGEAGARLCFADDTAPRP